MKNEITQVLIHKFGNVVECPCEILPSKYMNMRWTIKNRFSLISWNETSSYGSCYELFDKMNPSYVYHGWDLNYIMFLIDKAQAYENKSKN